MRSRRLRRSRAQTNKRTSSRAQTTCNLPTGTRVPGTQLLPRNSPKPKLWCTASASPPSVSCSPPSVSSSARFHVWWPLHGATRAERQAVGRHEGANARQLGQPRQRSSSRGATRSRAFIRERQQRTHSGRAHGGCGSNGGIRRRRGEPASQAADGTAARRCHQQGQHTTGHAPYAEALLAEILAEILAAILAQSDAKGCCSSCEPLVRGGSRSTAAERPLQLLTLATASWPPCPHMQHDSIPW